MHGALVCILREHLGVFVALLAGVGGQALNRGEPVSRFFLLGSAQPLERMELLWLGLAGPVEFLVGHSHWTANQGGLAAWAGNYKGMVPAFLQCLRSLLA